jgi:hypothetical protein
MISISPGPSTDRWSSLFGDLAFLEENRSIMLGPVFLLLDAGQHLLAYRFDKNEISGFNIS